MIYADRKWEVVFLGGSPVFRKDSYLDFDAMTSAAVFSIAFIFVSGWKGGDFEFGQPPGASSAA